VDNGSFSFLHARDNATERGNLLVLFID
jgi:hypothetical protein